MKVELDPVGIDPDIVGPAGRAWMVHLDAHYAGLGVERKQGNDVISWIVEAPWAHPVWHSYWVNLIHLRPVPGAQYRLYLPNATHEFTLAAINPEIPREKIIRQGPIPILHPLNFAAQLKCDSDAYALGRVEGAVRLICDGQLSPDSDYRPMWIKRFGGNMIAGHQSS